MDLPIKADINNMHVAIRGLLLSILTTSPFWYVDFYLFKKDFITATPLYIPILFAIALSLSLLLICFFIGSSTKIVAFGAIGNDENFVMSMLIGSLWAVALHSFVIGISFFFKLNIFQLLTLLFGLAIIICVIFMQLAKSKLKQQKERIQKQQSKPNSQNLS